MKRKKHKRVHKKTNSLLAILFDFSPSSPVSQKQRNCTTLSNWVNSNLILFIFISKKLYFFKLIFHFLLSFFYFNVFYRGTENEIAALRFDFSVNFTFHSCSVFSVEHEFEQRMVGKSVRYFEI